MFRPENVFGTFEETQEMSRATGIPALTLPAFRPERLIAHEVVIRVTADLNIPDGQRYEDLGISLRGMINAVLERHVAPEMPRLVAAFARLRTEVESCLREEIDAALAPSLAPSGAGIPGVAPRPLLRRIFRKAPAAPAPAGVEDRAFAALAEWTARAAAERDPMRAAALSTLAHVVGAIVRTRGRLVADHDAVVALAADRVCNDLGSDRLGTEIHPIFERACEAEGYRILPPQPTPLIMNVKGASAAGKSTMRSLQRELAGRLGVPWEDFALISPDYWRKFLLDYGSLGKDFKYAGALTGHELAIIDLKLDRHMARKAEAGRMSHLLIDRFRFDSFSPREDGPADTRLLTRFGSTVYLFFIVTPPEATVERAWTRGLSTGRFKAVDDLLHHNIEAFTGMPQLFFSWALTVEKDVHYEFLDNSVLLGERPRTIASGRNGMLNVYDIAGMLNVERFRKIDIDASTPDRVYLDGAHEIESNLGFLKQCFARLKRVEFVNPASRQAYGVVTNGRWSLWDGGASGLPPEMSALLNGLAAGAAPAPTDGAGAKDGLDLEEELRLMVGRID